MDSYLKKIREQAKISQFQMAERLNLSQAQISRLENDPDEITVKQKNAWLDACGKMIQGNFLISIDDQKRLMMLEKYQRMQEYIERKKDEKNTAELDKLSKRLLDPFMERKLTIGIFGHYDAGKTSLLSFLLGDNVDDQTILPTGFQPVTNVISYIRHLEDKPSWQSEYVWLMDNTFSIIEFDQKKNKDQQRYADEHVILRGSYDLLSKNDEHARHKNNHLELLKDKSVSFALVYINSPVLKALDLVDTPGFANNLEDTKLTQEMERILDYLIYMSPVTGFMDEIHATYLKICATRSLKLVGKETHEDSIFLNFLPRILVLASHFDTSKGRASLDTLKANLQERLGSIHKSEASDFAAVSLYSFSINKLDLSKDFLDHLPLLVDNFYEQRMDHFIETIKKFSRERITVYETNKSILKERSGGLIVNSSDDLNRKQKEIESARDLLRRRLSELCEANLKELNNIKNKYSLEYIRNKIEEKYGSDKQEAKRSAPPYILNLIEEDVSKALKVGIDSIKKDSNIFSQDSIFIENIDMSEFLENISLVVALGSGFLLLANALDDSKSSEDKNNDHMILSTVLTMSLNLLLDTYTKGVSWSKTLAEEIYRVIVEKKIFDEYERRTKDAWDKTKEYYKQQYDQHQDTLKRMNQQSNDTLENSSKKQLEEYNQAIHLFNDILFVVDIL